MNRNPLSQSFPQGRKSVFFSCKAMWDLPFSTVQYVKTRCNLGVNHQPTYVTSREEWYNAKRKHGQAKKRTKATLWCPERVIATRILLNLLWINFFVSYKTLLTHLIPVFVHMYAYIAYGVWITRGVLRGEVERKTIFFVTLQYC